MVSQLVKDVSVQEVRQKVLTILVTFEFFEVGDKNNARSKGSNFALIGEVIYVFHLDSSHTSRLLTTSVDGEDTTSAEIFDDTENNILLSQKTQYC